MCVTIYVQLYSIKNVIESVVQQIYRDISHFSKKTDLPKTYRHIALAVDQQTDTNVHPFIIQETLVPDWSITDHVTQILSSDWLSLITQSELLCALLLSHTEIKHNQLGFLSPIPAAHRTHQPSLIQLNPPHDPTSPATLQPH